jgi:flotillin
MQSLLNSLSSLSMATVIQYSIPIIVVVLFLSVLIAGWLYSRNYIKVSPNEVAVFSGRARRLPDGTTAGYRMVKGGAGMRWPLLEKVVYLSLNVMTIPLEIKRAYTVKGVPVSVKAVANVKIRGEETFLQAAAERFLSMSHDEIKKVIFQTLEGHLRSILGTLTVEEINNDRQTFAQKLTSEATTDLERMGIGVDVLTILEISDEEQYLDALGRRRTAEVKRDAEIGEAEAQRDSKMRASVALQEGERVKFDAEAQIAQAQYLAEVQAEQARAGQSGPLAEASAKQNVIAEQIRIDRIRTQEQIAVQEQEVLRRQRELEATIVKPAQAEQQAQIIRAEAEKQRQAIEADGKRQALIALAEAEQQRLEREGLGRAKATEAEGRAQAAKIEAIGLAEARAIEAKGLAEAAAILKKAAAWKEFNDAAKLQSILEKLPSVIESAAPVFAAIAEPLGSIDKVVVIDQGNGSAASGITRFAQTAPSLVFNVLEQLKALNIDVPELLGQLNGAADGKKAS